jgi:hypothetical protein
MTTSGSDTTSASLRRYPSALQLSRSRICPFGCKVSVKGPFLVVTFWWCSSKSCAKIGAALSHTALQSSPSPFSKRESRTPALIGSILERTRKTRTHTPPLPWKLSAPTTACNYTSSLRATARAQRLETVLCTDSTTSHRDNTGRMMDRWRWDPRSQSMLTSIAS